MSSAPCRLLLLAFATACSEAPTEPRPSIGPGYAIVDGAHSGNQQFYFLPPMVPAPSYSGTFDGTLSPTILICELAGGSCGATVATFTGATVKVDAKAQAYTASWKTKDAGLDPTRLYRVQVFVGTRLLGFADVVVLQNGNQVRTVDRNQYVATVNGGVLQIRFRIEGGAASPGWKNGDMVTFSQAQWGGDPGTSTGAALLAGSYASVYPGGTLTVGAPDPYYSLTFTSASAVLAYLPAAGASARLTADYTDPLTTNAGALGGSVLALRLNVDFSDAGLTRGTSTVPFGDLTLCGVPELTYLHGMTVRQFLAAMSQTLGNGGLSVPFYYFALVEPVVDDLNAAFDGGRPSAFAQAHLVNGACPRPWNDGDVLAYSQDSWGTLGTPAAGLLLQYFDPLHISGGVEIGVSGAGGNSAYFVTADAVLDYLPASGVPGPLDNDVLDPTSTSAGSFGGFVLALQLNIDYADTDYLPGNFPELRICALTTHAYFNGMTVRQFVAQAHQVLGAALDPFPTTGMTVDDYDYLADQLGRAFDNGVASAFAQIHLVNGSCQ